MVDSFLERLHRNDESLFRLELDKEFIGCNIHDLIPAIAANTTVRDVSIDNTFTKTLADEGIIQKLLHTIGNLPRLNKLYVRGFHLPMEFLRDFLKQAQGLKWLLLSDLVLTTRRDVMCLAEAIGDYVSLRHFSLFRLTIVLPPQPSPPPQPIMPSSSSLSSPFRTIAASVCLDDVIDSLSSLPSLEWVWIDMKCRQKALMGTSLTTLCRSKTLKELTLKRLSLDSDQIVSFSKVLQTNDTTLNRLRLWDCINLSDERGNAIAHLLETNRTLEELSLTHLDEVNANGCCAVAKAIAESNRTLKELVLTIKYQPGMSCCKGFDTALGNMIQRNSTLECLAILHDGLDDDGYVKIAKALESNGSLKKLVLRSPRRKRNNTNNLNLGTNNLGDEQIAHFQRGYQALLEMLRRNYVLESLITDAEGDIKAQMDFYLKLDRKLLLKTNASNDEWFEALAKQRNDLGSLFYLLSSNPSICRTLLNK